MFVVQTKWTFNHEGRGHRSLIGVSRGIGRPHRDTLGFSEYKIPYARCWDQFVRYQIVCDLPHRAERDPNTSLPTVRLPTWLDKWSLASPDARRRTPCPLPRRPSPKRTPSSSWKGLKYSIFNRDSRSHPSSDRIIFCCSSCRADPRHYFNRRWLQSIPGTSPIEVASHPSQHFFWRNSKFQWWKIYYEENFKKYISRSDRSTYVIQTLQDGSDVHARHGTTEDDIIADTQSHTHSRFVCTDTKLVDVVIFFPLISNVRWRAISPDVRLWQWLTGGPGTPIAPSGPGSPCNANIHATNKHMLTPTHTHMHAHAHTCTHMHTHSHTLTHTHTRQRMQSHQDCETINAGGILLAGA